MNADLYEGLPFLVRPENVARYEEGKVYILDRRIYPQEKSFVCCHSYGEVAQAIVDMVTQSGGPYFAVACGMALAAFSVRERPVSEQESTMQAAAQALGSARPTNNSIRYLSEQIVSVARKTLAEGKELLPQMEMIVEDVYRRKYEDALRLGEYAAARIQDGDCILNHCWAETCLIYTLRAALAEKKSLSAICSETRPYLQGARLTADAISEMGIPTTVVTDNMVGRVMQEGKAQVFLSGTDRVTRDGYVFNKVGTFQAALCAHYFGIPYYPLCHAPDPSAKTWTDVPVELRRSEESLFCMGIRTAAAGVNGYYPAFDVTPPELVTAIITGKGVFLPGEIEHFFDVRPQEGES
ncbi:MAG: S-methyl-5-thioribose-1-phosphate isomerase [Oscillospiraceae bacterium]|nr:S-methyl-5-thioribose-1-phosphate isomerase [Oscillospiraceae bacterium]